jgi:Cu(I)/Ag(I) efflux system protein CusF
MKTKLNAILAATAVAFAVAGHAQAQQAAAPSTQSASAESTSTAVFTDGEVRKVDKDAQKVTIKHGEIKNLDMPPMTMVFAVKDDAVLDRVKAGDKVQFRAIDEGGKLTVVEIQAAK